MKTKNPWNYPIAIVGLLLIFTLGCEKDDTKPDTPGCLITSATAKWVNVLEGGEETIESEATSNYTYDGNNRLIRIDTKTSWANDEEDDEDYFLFFYDSDGRIEKIEEYFRDEMEYIIFTWDGNKVTSQWYWEMGGTHTPSSSRYVYEFNSAGELIKEEGYWKRDGTWELNWYDLYTWEGGNPVKIESYRNQKKSTLSGPQAFLHPFIRSNKSRKKETTDPEIQNTVKQLQLSSTTILTYDNKNNPFSHHQALGLLGGGFPLYISKNNLLKAQPDDADWVLTLTYEYNEHDYPVIMTMSFDDDSYSIYDISLDCNL